MNATQTMRQRIREALRAHATTTKQIARLCRITETTARNHLKHMYDVQRIVHRTDPTRGLWHEWRLVERAAPVRDCTVRDAVAAFTVPVSARVVVAHLKATRLSFAPPTAQEVKVATRQLRVLEARGVVQAVAVKPVKRTDARVLWLRAA